MEKVHISSGGVVYRVDSQNKIEILLLHQRVSKKWHLPKGTQEQGEDLEQAALREVREETGCEVEIEKYLCKLPSFKEGGEPKITHYFLMKAVNGSSNGRSDEDKNKYDKVEWIEIGRAKKLLLLKKFKEFEDEKNAAEVAEKVIKEKYTMKLTILGSGSLIFKKERMAPAYLVEIDSGESFLFDCGATALQRFVDINFDYANLDHIVITHPHADHLGGLISLIFSIALKSLYAPYLGGIKREKPLFLHGYKGLADDYRILRKMMFAEPDNGFAIKIFEYQNKEAKFEKLVMSTRLVPHVEKYYKNKSIAVRLGADNKSLVYSGDCKYNESLSGLSKNADLALFECSSPEKGLSGSTHLTPEGAGKIAQKAGVKKLVLTHHYDIKSPKQILKEAKKYFSGEIIMAEDLMEIKI